MQGSHTPLDFTVIMKIKPGAWSGGVGWEGRGKELCQETPPKEVAPVGQNMQPGRFLTPRPGGIQLCLGRNVFLAPTSGKNQS